MRLKPSDENSTLNGTENFGELTKSDPENITRHFPRSSLYTLIFAPVCLSKLAPICVSPKIYVNLMHRLD